MKNRTAALIVVAAAVVALVALDVRDAVRTPIRPSGVALADRTGGSWRLPTHPTVPITATAGADGVIVVSVELADPTARFYDAERRGFAEAFPDTPERPIAENELFGTVAVNMHEFKRIADTEAAILRVLYDFARDRTERPARSTWRSRGYVFTYRSAGSVWSVTAQPAQPYRAGARSFYLDETHRFRSEIGTPGPESAEIGKLPDIWTAKHVNAILAWQSV